MTTPWSNQRVDLIILQEDVSGFSGLFGYSPSIGAGNLIFSLAAAAGTDPYGNAYPAGLNLTTGSITGTTFMGNNFTINSSGAFFYSGVPAAGNLIASIAPVAGADQFGNTYPAGFGVASTGEFLAGNVIVNSSGIFVYGAPAQVTVTKTSGSGTIPIPAGVTTVKAECWGGGCSGVGIARNVGGSSYGGGGGGGEYASEPALAVTGGGTVAYTVGAGGAGVSGGHNVGSNSTITGTSVTVTANGATLSGGTGSANTVHFNGGNGDLGFSPGGGGGSGGNSSAGNSATSSTGAAAVAGGAAGGNGVLNGTGQNASAPGGGGGGTGTSTNGNGPYTGGNGGSGQVQITYTPSTNSLLASIAPSSGTDQFGNAYVAGFVSYDTTNQRYTEFSGSVITLTSANAGTFIVSPASLHLVDALASGTNPSLVVDAPGAHSGQANARIIILGGSNATAYQQVVVTTTAVSGAGTTAALLEVQGTMALENESAPASVSGFAELFGNSGALDVVDGTDGNTYSTERYGSTIASQTITASSSPGTTLGSVNMQSGRTYMVHIICTYSMTASTANFKVGGPTASNSYFYQVYIEPATVSEGTQAYPFTSTSPAVTTTVTVHFEGWLTASSTAAFVFSAFCTTNGDNISVKGGLFEVFPVA